MKLLSVLVGLAAMLPLLSVPIPAHAEVLRVPLRCGMVVSQDAYVYLEKDLSCPGGNLTTGITVRDPNPTDDYFPSVTIDLQGHTLRGPGNSRSHRAYAIAPYPGHLGDDQGNLRVTNGRVENWTYGVVGLRQLTLQNLKLVSNAVGVSCGYPFAFEISRVSRCDVSSSYIARNLEFGLFASGMAVVKHTRFSYQTSGVLLLDGGVFEHSSFSYHSDPALGVANPGGTIKIRYSKFFKNYYGVSANPGSHTSIWRSAFQANGVGARIDGRIWDSRFLENDTAVAGGNECLELRRVRFLRNFTDTLGEIC